LPKIDDNIDTVLGLAVFYKYIRTTTFKQRDHIQHVSVFTTELFAHYFSIKHLLSASCCLAARTELKYALRVVKCRLREELKLYYFNKIASAIYLFVTDLMLLKFSNNSSRDELSSFTVTNSDSSNRQQLVQLLTRMPIQQMLRYRQLMFPQDVHPQFVAVVKTSDFMALRLYRCELYLRCAQLCQRAVYETIGGQVRPVARLCFLYPEFVQLMDDDVVSLIGMTLLVNKIKMKPKLQLQEVVNINKLTISLYLFARCQRKIQSSKWKPDMSPLADALDFISKAEKLIPSRDALDHLILKLAERLLVKFITERLNF